MDSLDHKLQYMNLSGQEDVDPRYNNRPPNSDQAPPFHQKQKSLGTSDRFTRDYGEHSAKEYAMYERSNIIAGSKFANPKQLETLVNPHRIPEENDVYVQCGKPQPQVPLITSPTRAMNATVHSNEDLASKQSSGVYENVEYYGSRGTPIYYQQNPAVNDAYHKARPQVASVNRAMLPQAALGNRGTLPKDGEAPPLYENVHPYSKNTVGATPGPQVPINNQVRRKDLCDFSV